MSVDLEEFEFAVVERFPAAFPGESAIVVKTPRAVVDHLATHATPSEDSALLLARAFYALRRQLASQLAYPLERITPRTRFADLLPDRESRPAQWRTLNDASGIRAFPSLVRPDVVARRIAVSVGLASLAAVSLAAASLGLTALVPLIGITVVAVATLAGLRLTSHLAREFMPPELTVGSLARIAVANGSPMLGVAYPRMTRSQIIEVVRELLALEADLPCSDLDATWEDLARRGR